MFAASGGPSRSRPVDEEFPIYDQHLTSDDQIYPVNTVLRPSPGNDIDPGFSRPTTGNGRPPYPWWWIFRVLNSNNRPPTWVNPLLRGRAGAPSVRGSSAPTEYGQSYTYSTIASSLRPRSSVSGWQTRNISNILPSGPELDPARMSQRAHHQSWPWLERQTRSQIFPDQQQAPTTNTPTNADINNNPGNVNGNARRPLWPWQARAREAGLLLTDGSQPLLPALPPPITDHRTRWPWQDRAMKSVIFDEDRLLTSKPLKHRNYQWDQRQSTSVDAAVHQNYSESSPEKTKTKKPAWPWEERAHQSVVFRSPDKVKLPRQVKYVWDQRKTRLSVKVDPKAKFAEDSLYKDSFVKWKPGQGSGPPAGKPCYNDDDVNETDKNVNASRRKYIKNTNNSSSKLKQGSAAIVLQSPPLRKSSSTSVKGASCLEIVPVGYTFPVAIGGG
ncbi:unnamed protein product [Orchesella dallaii]|uniref:Uncharacterized protein n=1 Tax=Orchesella dallaii TaxID=48710 RepID=A0ABP1PPF1_9HEXA